MGVADAPRLIPTAAGLAAHTSWMVLWGIAFAALSYRKTPAVTVLFALLVGLGASFIARSMVPAALGAVKFASMPSVQAALCVALMIAGLLAIPIANLLTPLFATAFMVHVYKRIAAADRRAGRFV